MKKVSIILYLLTLITIFLWIGAKEQLTQITDNPVKSIAQITALLGTVGYFVSFTFSSRMPFFEKLLPLDQSYKIHRTTGTLAGAGILLHITALIANVLPSTKALTLYLLPSLNISYTFGVIAFYSILTMLLSTLYMKLPYRVWNIIHKITSYSIIFATLHILLIPSDVSSFVPLRVWILFIVTSGVIGWVYRQFFYNKFAYRHEYAVTAVEKFNSILVISLTATKNPLVVEPGQFAFFKFYDSSKKVTTESHPFSVLYSTPSTLHIAVKEIGDFTKRLHQLQVGSFVKVAGPHGFFGKSAINSKRPNVWIAGGIGITPFYNLIATARATQRSLQQTSLFYTTTTQDQIFHPQILNYSNELGFSYHYKASENNDRFTPESILAKLDKPSTTYDYFLCGPKSLLTSMITYLEEIGVNRSHIFTEDFDFKSLDI